MELNNIFKNYIGIILDKRNIQLEDTGLLLSKNLVLTSCHCVTDINSEFFPLPNELNFVINGKNKQVRNIFRFAKKEIDKCIKELNKPNYFHNEAELMKIRIKLKNNLDFALLF